MLLLFHGLASGLTANPGHLELLFGATALPHPGKRQSGGEDAFFADTSIGAFGVADGVGGSATDTIDPGEFSRQMLKLCHDSLCSSDDGLRGAVVEAAEAFDAQSDAVGGSATLLLGQLAPETGSLQLLNVGDSTVLVLRPSRRRLHGYNEPVRWPRLVARTHEAQHYFNCPYQVCAETLAEVVMDRADELQVTLRPGDVVVAATDGLLDNIFESHVQELVAGYLRALAADEAAEVTAALNALAARLAKLANTVGLREGDLSTRTPFAEAARAEGIIGVDGGKLDDVTVVCGLVRSTDARAGEEQEGAPLVLSNFARSTID